MDLAASLNESMGEMAVSFGFEDTLLERGCLSESMSGLESKVEGIVRCGIWRTKSLVTSTTLGASGSFLSRRFAVVIGPMLMIEGSFGR